MSLSLFYISVSTLFSLITILFFRVANLHKKILIAHRYTKKEMDTGRMRFKTKM